MKLQQDLLSTTDDADRSTAYCLTHLEVFNWGPFCGLHRVEFDPAGCALIGQTGSGKTTLVDAIMTLICAQPRYNLASTGGHESDRDLMSYIRGVTGTGGDDETVHTARPGQTTTAISIEMSQAEQRIRLTALLWLDSSSTSQTDMKRLWLFDQSTSLGLSDHLSMLKELGIRGLKQQFKDEQGVLVTDNKKAYLAQCRRFFEVGENAFVLLNRAAGLKQLNSIDELFRELVLDNRAAFNRAHEVTTEFDELKGIHSELEIARSQQQSLIPVEKTFAKFQAVELKLNGLMEIQDLLPRWYAHFSHQLWSRQAALKQAEIKQLQSAVNLTQAEHNQQQLLVDDYYQRYQQLGGANIESLKHQLEEQRQLLSNLQQNVSDYQQLCRSLELSADVSQKQLAENQQLAALRLIELESRMDELESERDLMTQNTLNAEDQSKLLERQIDEVLAAPGSNIPAEFLHFQQALAHELQLTPEQIPYIGQCVEVQDKDWQGAIERAIGSHRLRLVVNGSDIRTALNWINQRDNRLHVRLMNASDYQHYKQPLSDGFCQKLIFKAGEHTQFVENFLASIDRHCVASAEILRDTAYGLTRQGLMSGKRGLFEKQDQRSLNQGWMTGFDNHNRLNELRLQGEKAKQQATEYRQQFETLKTEQKLLSQQQLLLQQLTNVEFSVLDVSGAESNINKLKQHLKELQDPSSDAAKAEQLWIAAKNELNQLQNKINAQTVDLRLAQQLLDDANKKALQLKQRIKTVLTQAQIDSVAESYAIPEFQQLEMLADLEREAMRDSQQKIVTQTGKRNTLEGQLVRHMMKALEKDTGALSEAGSDLEDVPAYLHQLKQLTREDLPNKLERFLLYLNQSSDQGVTQLLTRIDNEVSIIEERIEELNTTLKLVDFQVGRYLRLIPLKVNHESLQTLIKARKDLRSAELQDDQGESHYRALMVLIQLLREAVDRKRTKPAQALLDPRYRLQFSVAVIDRVTGAVLETRTGSKGGSGGEKEIIASFILTASLSYALCPKHRTSPLFGSVILDEAFSKSSQAVAARIISALREFGLHPLFVTPNKEMRLLREHTASAVLVHRRQQQSRALSLSWQDIDRHLSQREALQQKNNEIPG